MSSAARPAYLGRPTRTDPRSRQAHPDPMRAWRGLIGAVGRLDETHGPGSVTALREAAVSCSRTLFPVDGSDAEAGATALRALALTYGSSGEDARGHHRVLLEAAAAYCAVRLDQFEAARAAAALSRCGRD